MTPNSSHYEIAKAFLNAGIHVACEKPLCVETDEAEELQRLAEDKGLFFAVTYIYTGYGMVKFARELIAAGEIGSIVNVNAEYLQDWLIDEIGSGDESTSKMSIWRMNPQNSGISNCVGDIGTHIECTVSYMTGLKTKKVAAVLDHYGMELDMNANMLVEFDNGAHGVFSCSQVCAGHADGIAARRNHIPSGHPEGLVMAFANIYRAFQDAILKTVNGEELTADDMDFPSVQDGVDGVRFIHVAVKSSADQSAWTEL